MDSCTARHPGPTGAWFSTLDFPPTGYRKRFPAYGFPQPVATGGPRPPQDLPHGLLHGRTHKGCPSHLSTRLPATGRSPDGRGPARDRRWAEAHTTVPFNCLPTPLGGAHLQLTAALHGSTALGAGYGKACPLARHQGHHSTRERGLNLPRLPDEALGRPVPLPARRWMDHSPHRRPAGSTSPPAADGPGSPTCGKSATASRAVRLSTTASCAVCRVL